MLFVTSCAASAGSEIAAGGDPTTAPVVTQAPAPTDVPVVAAPEPTTQVGFSADPSAGGSAPSTDDPSACPIEFIGSGSYIVVNVPPDDPDDGLVGHTAPGVEEPVTGVYPLDFSVYVDGTPGSCHVVASGAVWWRVAAGDAPPDWVNAYYLGRYEGPAGRTAVGTSDALCRAWRNTVEARETDIAVAAELIALDVELGGHPVGVSLAIRNLVNGTSTDFSVDHAAIDGYVDPICNGTSAGGDDTSGTAGGGTAGGTSGRTAPDLSDEEYVLLADSCVYGFDPDACAQLEAAGHFADTNYGLGNSLSQVPWRAARDECLGTALLAPLNCSELWRRADNAVVNGVGSPDWFRVCGAVGLEITQFEPTGLDYAIAEYLIGDGGPVTDAFAVLQSEPRAEPWQTTVADALFAACSDAIFAD